MKSLRISVFAAILCGLLVLFAGCRHKSSPGSSSGKSDSVTVNPSVSDTTKTKPVSFASDQLIKRDYYLQLIG